MTMVVPQHLALRDKSRHAFKAGVGYVHVGPLRMPPDDKRKAKASACEPKGPVNDESWHWLRTPYANQPPIKMKWFAVDKHWAPEIPTMGRRLGFSSDYLAAHGWTYIGPVTAP